MNTQTRGVIEMTFAMTISGTVGWFVIQSGLAASSAVFWRCLFGGGAMLVICLLRRRLKRGIFSRRQLGWIVLGAVALALNWSLLFGAYAYTSISVATIVYHTQPFMLVGLGVVLLGERLTLSKLAWLSLSFVGLVSIVVGRSESATAASSLPFGIIMALGAAFFYAVAALTAKKLKAIPPDVIVLVQLCLAALMLLPFAGKPLEAQSWAMLLTIGIVHTALMSTLLYGALQKLPTSLIGVLSFIYPVVAVAVDWLAFNQRMNAIQFAGAGAILLSAAAMNLGWTLSKRQPASSISPHEN